MNETLAKMNAELITKMATEIDTLKAECAIQRRSEVALNNILQKTIAELDTAKGDYQSCHVSFMTQMDINTEFRAERDVLKELLRFAAENFGHARTCDIYVNMTCDCGITAWRENVVAALKGGDA
jgi:hypothetical protein